MEQSEPIVPIVPGSASTALSTVECPFCAQPISPRAKKCNHCHETVDPAMRRAEEALRAAERANNNGPVYMNAAVSQPMVVPAYGYGRPEKSRVAAIILALFLGGFGIHKFYLGRAGQGILYMLFFWTFIPACIAFIEAIVYACSSEEGFHYKYG